MWFGVGSVAPSGPPKGREPVTWGNENKPTRGRYHRTAALQSPKSHSIDVNATAHT